MNETGNDAPRRREHRLRPPRSARAAVALAVVLVVAAAVSACGSSSDGAAPATTAGSATTASTAGATAGADGPAPSGTAVGDGSTETTGGPSSPSTDGAPLERADLGDDEVPFADALAAQGSGGGMTDDQSHCLAGYTVQAIGVDAFTAAGVTPDSIASGASSMDDLTIDAPTAQAIVDGFEPCGIDIVAFLVAGLTGDVIDPATKACIAGLMTPEAARAAYVSSITDRAAGTPIEDTIAPCVPSS